MKRFTETEKWSDAWFRSLSPLQKCVFTYCCDRCNNAGFIEIDFDLWCFHIGGDVIEIEKAFACMCNNGSRIIVRSGWAYIKNYLRHQKNLPLFPHKNPAHKNIVHLFTEQAQRFPKLLDTVVLESLNGEDSATDYRSDDWLQRVCRIREEDKIEVKPKTAKVTDENQQDDSKKKERNPIIDALAECDGDPLQIPKSAWGRIAKALSEIKSVCADVTPEEIKRRASNYKTHFKDAPLTSTALAKHWSRCDKASGQTVSSETTGEWGDLWVQDRT